MTTTTSVSLQWHGDEWMRDNLIPAASKTVVEVAKRAAAMVVTSLGSNHGGVPSRPFSPPNTQTGNLRGNIGSAGPEFTGDPLRAAFGTNAPYAKMLEFGGTIRAKGKKLVVPLNKEAALALKRVGGNTRALRLRLIPRKGKPPLLVSMIEGAGRTSRKGKGGHYAGGERMKPMFILLSRVTIQARPFLRPIAHNPDNRQKLASFAREVFTVEMARRRKGAA